MSSDHLHSVIKVHEVRYSLLICPSELFVTFSEDKIRPSDLKNKKNSPVPCQSTKLCNFCQCECTMDQTKRR